MVEGGWCVKVKKDYTTFIHLNGIIQKFSLERNFNDDL